jgi:GxxExxY protein
MFTDEQTLNSITETIIGCAFKVGSGLGSGFLEKCYENAMVHELRKARLLVEPQSALNVFDDGIVVGEYFTDLIVEGLVMVELKAVEKLASVHAAQCIHYLAAARLPICLLINFAQRVEVRRIAGRSLRGKENESHGCTNEHG